MESSQLRIRIGSQHSRAKCQATMSSDFHCMMWQVSRRVDRWVDRTGREKTGRRMPADTRQEEEGGGSPKKRQLQESRVKRLHDQLALLAGWAAGIGACYGSTNGIWSVFSSRRGLSLCPPLTPTPPSRILLCVSGNNSRIPVKWHSTHAWVQLI